MTHQFFFARLPRRYSDRHRDASAPIVGSSGSTPLHFAAANGHTSVIRTLLLHGAHADRADKHSITPEMLARDNGHLETAEVLKEWLANKDKDLREREELNIRDRTSSADTDNPEHSVFKRLHAKCSIDNTLNSIKPHSFTDSHSGGVFADGLPKRYASTGEPSITRIFDMEFDDSLIHPLSKYSRQPSGRRPRSAGTGADRSSEGNSQRSTGSSRKLGSKYSLRNLFKKAADTPSTPDSPYTNSSNPSASTSTSPSPGGRGSITLPHTPPHSTLPSSPLESSPLASQHMRVASETNIRHQEPLVHMHNSIGQSPRVISGTRHGDSALVADDGEDDSPATPPSRPGILLSHGRSSSSGQSQQNAPFRALRFEASSSSSLSTRARGGAAKVLSGFSPSREMQKSSSAASLNNAKFIAEVIPVPDSAPAAVGDFHDSAIDGDDEEYGEVIQRPSIAHLKELQIEGRPRGLSLTSSNSSLSPIISPDTGDSDTAPSSAEFPFSISRPPPADILDEHLLTVPYPTPPLSAIRAEIRHRGDSISSLSTDASTGSRHPEMSWSHSTVGTTSTIENESTSTPATSQLALSRPAIASPGSVPRDGLVMPSISPPDRKDASFIDPSISHGMQRSRTPVNIDIQSISSYAQAEALVQRAQESILAMGAQSDEDPKDSGRSPLSAKLAAYGESLALERKFKEAELGKVGEDDIVEEVMHPRSSSSSQEPRKSSSPRIRDVRVLEIPKRGSNPSRSRIRQPRRPNTSDSGELIFQCCIVTFIDHNLNQVSSTNLFTPERPSHHSSRSTSFVETNQFPKVLPDLTILENPPHTAPCTPNSDNLDTTRIHLSRSTTSPMVDNFMDAVPSSNHLPTTRNMASANKLTRMGFSVADVVISAPPKPLESKSRFGLKSFFKGKTQ